MKTKELKDKSSEDLQKELSALLKEQFNLRIQRGTGQEIQAHLFGRIRKDIARIKTLLRQREILV